MALSFDDLLKVEGGMDVSLDVDIPDNLFDLDNSSYDIIQTDTAGNKCQKKSPFHESDSGMSEDFNSVDLNSPQSVTNSSGKMLDEFVDALEFEPFCHGADKDLSDYFCSASKSESEEEYQYTDISSNHPVTTLMTQTSVSSSRSSSPEIPVKSLRNRVVQANSKAAPVSSKTVCKSPPHDNVTTSQPTGIQSVKVLKVIKTSGNANTATEVLKALDDRNKKNAVQAKVNREKKKLYIKCLEDQVSDLTNTNGHLKVENDSIKHKNTALEEEVQYLRAVLANESSLSRLLGNIENVQNVKLKSSFASRKRSAAMDHDYTPSKKSKQSHSTAGVCLHVDNDTVSLEFCSKCSKMAKSSDED
ncbi:uncharacterized protein LOC124278623 isoform X1 [Haliotis rubra]|uniref:uncharacterized protein LOC124278623 isoform X1 n=2 Tax=Haliotis rubra TaxID=36100 RepID=UPI001EE52D14|nr:uncharacterized protein LOC124278623 isoform X1 [Haliotis rubra]